MTMDNLIKRTGMTLMSTLLAVALAAGLAAQEAFSAAATPVPHPIITNASGQAVFQYNWDPAISSGKCSNFQYFSDVQLNLTGTTATSVTVSGSKTNGRGDFRVDILDQSGQTISSSAVGSTASSGAFTRTLTLNPSVAYSSVGAVFARCD